MKKMMMVMTVLTIICGTAFTQGISPDKALSYTKKYTCGHKESAYTTDKGKAGKIIEVFSKCDACKYDEKRKSICTNSQSTQENRDTYNCNKWGDTFGY